MRPGIAVSSMYGCVANSMRAPVSSGEFTIGIEHEHPTAAAELRQ